MNELLKVEDLGVGLPKRKKREIFWPVEHVSFSIRAGETLALVGESGSGKSMTALTIMGLLQSWNSYLKPSFRGTVSFTPRAGETFRLDSLSEREYDKLRGKDMSMIFQEPLTVLNPVIPIGKQVEEVILAHERISEAEAKERVIGLLKSVEIPNAAERYYQYPHQFSGGQLQRIVIAMAIACDCRLLIADEPTTALDVTIQAQILKLLARLQKERDMGILLITHDFGVVSQFADRVAVMYAGNIVEYGSVKQIFTNPSHPYTRLLIASIPTLDTEPGKPLLTKEDFLAGRDLKIGEPKRERTIFDPERKITGTFSRIAEGHYISSAYMREVFA